MRTAGLRGVMPRATFVTTHADPATPPTVRPIWSSGISAPRARSRLWVADITYIPTWAGFLYLAVVLDACRAASSAG